MKVIVALPFIAIAILAGCKSQISDASTANSDLVYFNSFESQADTAGWFGYGQLALHQGAPPDGGLQSAYISGGCIVPHARIRLTTLPPAGTITLKCWGMNLALGGAIQLSKVNDPQSGLLIAINDTAWTAYQADGSMTYSSLDTLELEMMSGGIVSSAMLVDRIEIRRVDN
ncbi:MAG: hypothetical protein WBD36_08050 [Bacteroidota bacterium]